MAGTSVCLESGSVLDGKHGKYLLKDSIGSGGNGTVFSVDVIEGNELPWKGRYAIKVFKPGPDNRDYKKKRSRFIKEVENVLSFQKEVSYIIPIYDSSIYCDKGQDLLWYLMPRASRFNPQRSTFSQRLEYMLQIGKSLKKLHSLGYAHRDIKPSNLLFFKDQLYLADFGLVWNSENTEEHITEVNDRLGPIAIQPPELQFVEDVEGVDYRKSDVYLYAKTLWMILLCNNRGFHSEYTRTNDHVYIDKEKYQLQTAEPLHCLMEGATKHNWAERIDIDDCLFYLNEQLRVVINNLPQKILKEYKYTERTKRIDAKAPPDKKEYTDPLSIIEVLNELSEIVSLVFVDAGKEYGQIPLRKASHIQGHIFEIEIRNPYNSGRKKSVELMIESIRSKKDSGYEIQSNTYTVADGLIPEYTQILKALESSEKHIRLNSKYLIRMVK